MRESTFQAGNVPARAGTFVGGPTQGSPSRARTIRTGEDTEARNANRYLRRRGNARSVAKHTLIGAAVLVGLATGTILGQHKFGEDGNSPSDLAVMEKMIDGKISRVMAELWKMEAVEAARGRGRF